MLIFLCFSLIVCIYFIDKFLEKSKGKKDFVSFMDKLDSDEGITKSDLISFRHELGETIFDIQKEIEKVRLSVEEMHEAVYGTKFKDDNL